MASRSKFRHEDVAAVPRGWRVRTITEPSGHEVRIAFPPGPREKGKGKLISILHPKSEHNPCKVNPASDAISGLLWGAGSAIGTTLAGKLALFNGKRKKKNPVTAYSVVRTETSQQEVYDPKSGDARKRAKQLRDLGFKVSVESMGPQVTGVGLIPLTMLTVHYPGDREIPPPDRVERLNPKARKNQDGAEALYESFHGRSPQEVLTVEEEIIKAGTYWSLGTAGGLWLNPPPHTDKGELDVDRLGKPDIEFSDGSVKLAGFPGETQLYFIGGDQELPLDYLKELGEDTSKDFIPLGIDYVISYITEKVFDGYQTSEYAHEFGEETGERPMLFYAKRAMRIVLVGGAYRIADKDKLLKASPGIVN